MAETKCSPLLPRIGVAAVASPLEVGADRAPRAADDLAALLRKHGCDVVPLGAISAPDQAADAGRKLTESHVHAVAFIATSWFEDYLALDLLEECPVPALIWPERHGVYQPIGAWKKMRGSSWRS